MIGSLGARGFGAQGARGNGTCSHIVKMWLIGVAVHYVIQFMYDMYDF